MPYEKEQLAQWCAESDSYNQVLVKSGRTKASSNRNILKKYIALYNIDISHFTHSTSSIKSSELRQLPKEKKCEQCNQIKDTYNDFYWSNGHTRNICKECVRKNQREKYTKQHNELIEYKKTLQCRKCGEKRYYLLDFHHKDMTIKDYAISDRPHTSMKTLQIELEKCDPLCANCHREFHYLIEHNLIQDYETWLNT